MTEKPRKTQAESYVVELKEKVNNSSLMKHPKSKAAASHELTLVEHATFVEAILRVLAGSIEPTAFLAWFTEPGEAEFERIPGNPTNLLV